MLSDAVFRTSDVPVTERFDAWREFMATSICPMDMSSDYADAFEAEMRLMQIGAARVWDSAVRPMRWQRTPRLIQRSDPEFCQLVLPLNGTVRVSQAGREAVHGPHEMYVFDSSQPWDIVTGAVTGMGLQVPKSLLPLSPGSLDRLLTRRLPGREGVGALLAQFLTRLSREAGTFQASDAAPLETVMIDLLSATLAHHLEEEDRLPPETRTRCLTKRIRAFIQHHLHDPELGPRDIAAAHHISVSYLHRLFRTEGTTVAAWIREQRLERARRDLADAALRLIPVHEIAARWGFTYHESFTRAFQAAYGMAPRDFRQQALVSPT